MDVKASNTTNETKSTTMLASSGQESPWSMEDLVQHFGKIFHGIIQYLASYPVAVGLLIYLGTVMAFMIGIAMLYRRLRKFTGLEDFDVMMAREIRTVTGIREEIESGRAVGAKRIQYNFSFTWDLPDTVRHTVNAGNRSVRFLDTTLSDSDISLTLPPVPVTPVNKKPTFGRIRDSIALTRRRLTGPRSAPPNS